MLPHRPTEIMAALLLRPPLPPLLLLPLLLLLAALLALSAAFTPSSNPARPGARPRLYVRPLPAQLTQIEVRQATKADFPAIAQTRPAVFFIPEGVSANAGTFRVGKQEVPVANEEERFILSRIPFLVAGQAIAFLVEGRESGAKGISRKKVVAASVDVSVREAEGPSLPRRVFIKNLTVDEAYRRQGHARRLLAAVEGYAGQMGVGEVHLEVLGKNEGALALYESEGFELLPEPFNLLARAMGVGKCTMRKQIGEAGATTTTRVRAG